MNELIYIHSYSNMVYGVQPASYSKYTLAFGSAFEEMPEE
jgi:hypothetical protein